MRFVSRLTGITADVEVVSVMGRGVRIRIGSKRFIARAGEIRWEKKGGQWWNGI